MQSFETVIDGLSHDGKGVTRLDGKAVFVSGALPGERVRAVIRRKHRRYDEADCEAVIEASPDRVEPRCPHFGVCAGCALQHLSVEAQIESKRGVLLENLSRIGKVEPEHWLPSLQREAWAYRRRGRLSVKFVEKKGRLLVGFREGNGRYVADIQSCAVLDPRIGERIEAITDEISALDAVREIAQIEFAIGEDAPVLVLRNLVTLGDADRARLVAFAQQQGYWIYLQPAGPESVHALWPEAPRLHARVESFDLDFEFKPLDFIQVNAQMNQAMLGLAMELLEPAAGETVLDLFCGLGNFTLPIARLGAEVVGVEGDNGLVQRARHNATLNGLEGRARFEVANLFEDHRQADWARRKWDKLLLDPPRSGAQEVLAYLPAKQTRRVVYVSCHPASLARDAGLLVHEHGFKLRSAGVMDMFPHTGHVESIALFERS